MKFYVSEDCTACGLCEATCPEVFEVDGDIATVKLDPVPEEYQESALEAEDACPVEAISHEDD
jgi:ferredoxin